ncbi:hypothetical protein GCM10017600_40390 [Streptosporangium carneum]|uniref:Uncharacterized protein n=1 Tax=Streptosporangium carneum TaxID=47481 RepID=A0A9W6ME90_9ACTN|nr:hypothetical protein GCM10017600_40390 [Streptosporangium carneum]
METEPFERGVTVVGDVDGQGLRAQAFGDRVGEHAFVFDDQYAQRPLPLNAPTRTERAFRPACRKSYNAGVTSFGDAQVSDHSLYSTTGEGDRPRRNRRSTDAPSGVARPTRRTGDVRSARRTGVARPARRTGDA